MGNTIFDRIVSQESDLSSIWPTEYEDCLSAFVELNREARNRPISKLGGSLSERDKRMLPRHESDIEFDYQTAVSRELRALIPQIESRASDTASSLKDHMYLGELRNNARENTDAFKTLDQLKLFISEFTQTDNEFKKKIQNEKENSRNNLNNFIEAQIIITKEKSADGQNQTKETNVKRRLMAIIIQDILSNIDEIKFEKKKDTISDLTEKLKQITSAFSDKETLETGESDLKNVIESLAREVLELTTHPEIKLLLHREAIEAAVLLSLKLSFYIKKPSLQFFIISEIIKHELYLGITSIINENYIVGNCNTIRIEGPPTSFELSLKNAIDASKSSKTSVICDNNNLYLAADDLIHIFNRTPDFDQFRFLETVENKEKHHPILFKQDIWILQENKIYRIHELEGKKNGMTLDKPPLDVLEAHFADHTKTCTIVRTVYIGGDGDLFWGILYFTGKLIGSTDSNPKLFRMVFAYKMDTLNNELKIEKKACKLVLHEDMPLSAMNSAYSDSLTVFYSKKMLIELSSKKKLTSIELSTGLALSKDFELETPIDGVDWIRNVIFEIDYTTQQLKVKPSDVVSRYFSEMNNPSNDVHSNGEDAMKYSNSLGFVENDDSDVEDPKDKSSISKSKAKKNQKMDKSVGPVYSWLRILLRLAMSSKSAIEMNFEDEGTRKTHAEAYSNQSSKLEFTSAAFESIVSLIDRSSNLPLNCSLLLLKLCEIYLSECCLFQDLSPEVHKVITQENIFKTRSIIMQIGDRCTDLTEDDKEAFDLVWIKCIRHIGVLSVKIQNIDTSLIVDSLFSNNALHKMNDVQRIFDEYVSTNFRTLGNREEFLEKIIQRFIKKSNEVTALELKAIRVFFNPANDSIQKTLESVSIVKTNMRRILTILVRMRKNIGPESIITMKKHFEEISNKYTETVTRFAQDFGSRLSNTLDLIKFDRFIMRLFTTDIFYRELTLCLYNSQKNSLDDRLLQLSKSFVWACKSIVFAQPEKLIDTKPQITIPLTVKPDSPVDDLIKVKYISFPNYRQVKLVPSGFDPLFDSFAILTVHSCDSVKVCEEGSDKELVVVPHACINGGKTIEVDMNQFFLAIRSQLVEGVAERTISLDVYGTAQINQKICSFQSLYEICLEVMVDSCKEEIKRAKKCEDPILTDSQFQTVNIVLSSSLFANGFDHEAYISLKKIVVEPVKEEEMLEEKLDEKDLFIRRSFHFICTYLNLSSQAISSFNDLCSKLQSATVRKSIHSKLLGENGFILVKSALLTILHHSSSLSSLLKQTWTEESIKPFESLWLLSTKVRVLCRSFEVSEQFEEFFNKIFILISLQPSYSKSDSATFIGSDQFSSDVIEVVRLVKTFFDELKLRKFAKSKELVSAVPELIIKFISFEAESNKIISLLDVRKKEFESFGVIIDTIESLMEGNKQDMSDTIILLNHVFRKEGGSVDYLSVDSSGLSKENVQKRLNSLKNIFTRIVEYLCQKEHSGSAEDNKVICMAIDTLKWLWRPSELPCVLAIDPESIIISNPGLLNHTPVVRSLVELTGVVIEYCATHGKDIGITTDLSGISNPKSPDSILNRSIEFLFELIHKNIKYLKNCKSLPYDCDWEEWLKSTEILQRKIFGEDVRYRIQENISNKVEKTDKIEFNEGLDISQVGFFNSADNGIAPVENKIGQTKDEPSTKKPEEPQEASGDAVFGGLFDDDVQESEPEKPQEVETPAPKPAEVAPKNVSQNKESVGESNSLRNVKHVAEHDHQVSSSINITIAALTSIYHSIHISPFISNLLIRYIHNLDDLIMNEIPSDIRIFAIKLLKITLLNTDEITPLRSNLLPFLYKIVSENYVRLFKIKDHLPFSDNQKYEVLEFIRSLLMNDRYTNEVQKYLFDSEWNDEFTMFVLEVLDLTCTSVSPGAVVFHVQDKLKEQYILAGSNTGLLAKAYLKDEMNFRNDVKYDKNLRKNMLENRRLTRGVVCICVRTKNYRIFNKDDLRVVEPQFNIEMYNRIIDILPMEKMIEKIGNNTGGTLCIYRLSSIIRLTHNIKYNTHMMTILSKHHIHIHHPSVYQCLSPNTTYLNHIASSIRSSSHSKLSSIDNHLQPEPHASMNNKYLKMKQSIYGRIKRDAPSHSSVSRPADFNIFMYGTQNDECFDIISSKMDIMQVCRYMIYTNSIMYRYSIRCASTDTRQLILDVHHMDTHDVNTMVDVMLNEIEGQMIKDMLDDIQTDVVDPQTIHSSMRLASRLIQRVKDDRSVLERFVEKLYGIIGRIVSHAGVMYKNRLLIQTIVLCVDMYCILAPVVGERELSDSEIDMLDDIMEIIDVEEGYQTYTMKTYYKYEKLSNVVYMYVRCVLSSCKIDHTKLKKNSKAYEFVRKSIDDMKVLKEEDNEDIRIKGILMYKVCEDRENMSKWVVDLNGQEKVKKIDFIDSYTDWMVIEHDNVRSVWSLMEGNNESDLKSVFKYMKKQDTVYNDLCVSYKFKSKKDTNYYITNKYSRDYFLSNSLELMANSIQDTMRIDKNAVTVGLCSSYLVNGSLYYFSTSYACNTILLDGVSCANKNFRACAMYVEKKKELLLFDESYYENQEKYPNFCLRGAKNESNFYCIDLNAHPKIESILWCFEQGGAVLRNEDKDYMFINISAINLADSGNEEANAIESALYYIFHESKPSSLNSGILYFKANPNFEITALSSSSEHAYVGLQFESKTVFVNWSHSSSTAYITVFNNERIKKLVTYSSYICILFESNNCICKEKAYFSESYMVHDGKFEVKDVFDVILIYRQVIAGLRLMPDALDPSLPKKLVFVALNDQNNGSHEIAQARLTQNSRFIENPQIDARDIWLTECVPIESVDIWEEQFGANSIAKLPFIITHDKDKSQLVYQSIDKKDDVLENYEIAIIVHHSFQCSLSESGLVSNFDSYRSSSINNNPQSEAEKSMCISYNLRLKTTLYLQAPPTEEQSKDLAFTIISKNRFRSDIEKLLTPLLEGITDVQSNTSKKIYFMPDIFSMNNDDFKRLKEETKDIWEPLLETTQKNYIRYRDAMIDINKQNLNNDLSGRSYPRRLMTSFQSLQSTTEYGLFKEGGRPNFDEKEFNIVTYVMKIYNYIYLKYYMRIPSAFGRNLEYSLLPKIQHSVFPSFFMSRMNPTSNDRVIYCKADKYKGLNNTSLLKQNYSLLNQFIYSFDKGHKERIWNRRGFERHRIELIGEGSIDAGGPRREYLDHLAEEVVNKLKLFIPSPNNKHNVGEERDKYVPNPVANSYADLENFYKFGILLGCTLKVNDVLNMNIHPSLFKYIIGNIT